MEKWLFHQQWHDKTLGINFFFFFVVSPLMIPEVKHILWFGNVQHMQGSHSVQMIVGRVRGAPDKQKDLSPALP